MASDNEGASDNEDEPSTAELETLRSITRNATRSIASSLFLSKFSLLAQFDKRHIKTHLLHNLCKKIAVRSTPYQPG